MRRPVDAVADCFDDLAANRVHVERLANELSERPIWAGSRVVSARVRSLHGQNAEGAL